MTKNRILAAALVALLVLLLYLAWQSGLIERLSRHEELVLSMRRSGIEGPLLCIGIQFLQVVLFVIPGEITQVAAGYVFGAWLGFVYSAIGIMLGSAFDFAFARHVGRPVVEKILGAERMARVDTLLESSKGKSTLFVLFLLPGLPKDALSYGAGLTKLGLGEFIVLSGLGRSPALLFSTLIGSQLYQRDYRSIVIISVAGLAAILGFYFYEKRRNLR